MIKITTTSKSEHQIDKYLLMYKDYKTGLSLSQVGQKHGITRQSVYEGFKRRNLKMRAKEFKSYQIFDNKKFSLRPTGYYELTSGERTQMHIYVWNYFNGDIKKGMEIHHIDFDKSNNEISNLMMLSKSDHTKLHSKILKGAANNKPVKRISDGKQWVSVAQLCRDLGTESVKAYLSKGKTYKNERYVYVKG